MPWAQVYRGETFGDLFRTYTSKKPVLVSEYGVDAYRDVISDAAMVDGLHVDAANREAGAAYQARAIPRLAREIEAQDPSRAGHYFAATMLVQGDVPDQSGGWAILHYNSITRDLTYDLYSRAFPDRTFDFEIPGLLNIPNHNHVGESREGLESRE